MHLSQTTHKVWLLKYYIEKQLGITNYYIAEWLTGTTKSVDRKWHKYEIKYGSEVRGLPSTSIVRGISGTKLKAALKHASAGGKQT
jgi:hypothetical protein